MTKYPLPKSYKNAYPFRLGTTSFIYPDTYVPNVRMLAPYLDEIELLLFESASESLPTKHEIETLALLSEESDVTYNIHLPTDISLTDPDSSARCHTVETIHNIMNLTSPLSPSTYTLHLPYNQESRKKEDVKKWQERTNGSMIQLTEALSTFHFPLSIETLDYPFEWAEKIVTDHNLSLCMDIGHLMVHGFDAQAFFQKYADIISIIHLHGVENGQDHIALNRLSEKNIHLVMKILKQFRGVVSLEVFSYHHLNASLNFLEEHWQIYQKDSKN